MNLLHAIKKKYKCAEHTTETIFNATNFDRPFYNDLASSRRSIVISTTRLRWNRTPRIIELLATASLRGINITIIISEKGHREVELHTMGFNLIHRPSCKMQSAIIDQRIGWYGSVNFMGKSITEATAIRIPTQEFANSLLEALNL